MQNVLNRAIKTTTATTTLHITEHYKMYQNAACHGNIVGARTWARLCGKAWFTYSILAGYPAASRAYAWSSPIEGSDKRRFLAVLHQAAGYIAGRRCKSRIDRRRATCRRSIFRISITTLHFSPVPENIWATGNCLTLIGGALSPSSN